MSILFSSLKKYLRPLPFNAINLLLVYLPKSRRLPKPTATYILTWFTNDELGEFMKFDT